MSVPPTLWVPDTGSKIVVSYGLPLFLLSWQFSTTPCTTTVHEYEIRLAHSDGSTTGDGDSVTMELS